MTRVLIRIWRATGGRVLIPVAVVVALVVAVGAFSFYTGTGAGLSTAQVGASSITLGSTSGYVSQSVSISGSQFTPNKSLTATFNGASVGLTVTTSTNSSGAFSGALFTVPAITAGTYTVTVTAGSWSASAPFTVLAPPVPTVSSTTPASPNSSTTPSIVGTALANTTVKLYTNSSCTTAVVPGGSGIASGGNFSISVTVGAGTTTTYYATATDAGGNVSGCSSTHVSYTNAVYAFAVSNPGTQTAGTAFGGFTVQLQDNGVNTTTYNGSSYTNASQTVTFSGPGTSANGHTPSYPSTLNFTNGLATVGATAIKLFKAETPTLTVADTADGISGSTSFTVNPAATATLSVSSFPSSTTAGVAHSFTVTALDAFGNTAMGYLGTVHFTTSDGQATAGAGLPSNYTFVAGDNGVHTTFSATLKTAGTQSITATDTVTSSITGSQTGITVNPAGTAVLAVTAFPSPTTAGVAHNFTVTAQDAFGNTTPSYTGTVHFASSDGQATAGAGLPSNYTFVAGDNGVHSTFSATLKTAGTQSITATDTVTSSITGSQTGITVNPAGAASLSVSGYTTPTTAGVSHSFTVTALDAFGNTATGYLGTVHFTNTNDAAAVLPSNYTFLAGDAGTKSFSATFKTVAGGTKTLTATDTVTSSITGSQTGITVNPAGAASLSVSGYTTPTTAGVSHSFTVTALDAFGNTATGYTGTVSFSATNDAAAVLPSNYTFLAGDAGTKSFSATFKTVAGGTKTLTATDTVTSSITGSQTGITVNPAGAASLSVSGYTTPTTAGVSHSFTVTALDAFGNTATGYTGTVSFSATNDAAAVLPSNYTFLAGDAGTKSFSATFKTVAGGTKTLTATDTVTSSITGSQTGITVNPAGAASLSVSGYTTPTTAGVSHSFTVTALDAFGNTATGYTGTVSFSATNDAAAVLPSNYTFLAGDAGTKSFSATFKTVAGGTKTLTATDTVTSSITGSQTGITVTAAAANSIALVSGTPQSATVSTAFTSPLVALVSDAFGNPVSGASVTFAAPTGAVASGTFASSGCTSNSPTTTCVATTVANGQATSSTFTANATAGGPYSVSASATGTNTVNFSLTNSSATATKLVLAGSSSMTAGGTNNLTITAENASGGTATSYTGSKNLTFADTNTGGGVSPNGTHPTVTNSSGTAVNLGSTTAINFVNGQATVQSTTNNGVMALYDAETATITVSDGTINNNTAPLSVAVSAGTATNLAWTSPTFSEGTPSSPCLFTCTDSAGHTQTFTAYVSVTDANGNIVSGLGSGHAVTVNPGSHGTISGGGPLTIPSTGPATTSTEFTYTTPGNSSGSPDTVTAATTSGTTYTSATATISY